MKHWLLGSLLLVAGAAQAQIKGKIVREYTTRLGTVFHPGDTLRLGTGTDIGRSFKHISIPPGALTTAVSRPLSAKFANRRVAIKELRQQDMGKRIQRRTVAVINIGGFNDVVDLNAAEATGEIRTANNRRRAAPAK